MKLKPESFALQDYLHQTFTCGCGRIHHTDLERILLEAGAVRKVPQLIRELGYRKVFVVSDQNTRRAAGEQLERILTEAGIPFVSYCFSQDPLVPDEHAAGELLMRFDHECDLILGVGTGTINDLCKFMSYQLDRNYFIFATAPSMDGFVSIGAALIDGNMKVTHEAHVPQAVIGDVDILAQAPMDMIAAGVADVMGKYTCLCDWRLAHTVTGEYFCPEVEKMVRIALKRMMDQVKYIKTRDPATIEAVMEALILTGIAMSFVGNSRPASGCEHHISHYWEMMFLFEGRQAVLHGTKVGIGTVIVSRMYRQFLRKGVDYQEAERKADTFDLKEWEEEMKRVYGPAAQGVISLERSEGKNFPEGVKLRLKTIRGHMSEIRQMIETLAPDSEAIQEVLIELGAPVSPAQLGISRDTTADSIKVAKEVRNRYTLLQFLWDLGLLEEMAEENADEIMDGGMEAAGAREAQAAAGERKEAAASVQKTELSA